MKRREFIAKVVVSGGVGAGLAGRAVGAEPCPPPSLQAVGGTTAATSCPTAVATSAPSWLQNRSVNEWFQIPGTALASVPPSPVPGGITGPQSKISAWCGATLKRSGSVYLIAASGGHGDYYGNEVNAITLSANSPSWRELRGSSADSNVVHLAPVGRDFRRSSTHTYYSTQFINQDNRLVLTPAPGPEAASLPQDPSFLSAYPADRLFCSFSLDTNDWDATEVRAHGRGFYANWPDSGDWIAALACSNPSTGDVYYARGGGGGRLWRWTRATDTWTALATISATNYSGSAIDPGRGRMLVVGDYSGTANPRVYRIDTGAAVGVSFTGLGANALKAGGYPGVLFDEHNDRFLVFKNGSPITVLSVNAATWEVQPLATSGTLPGPRPNGILNSAQYVPELRGVVIATSYSGNLHFMRVG